MGIGGGGPSARVVAEINVTPLVDVMLVLLIIFMVTAPMLNQTGVQVDLPREDAPPMAMPEDAPLVLSIERDKSVWLNELKVPDVDLSNRLAALARANPDQPVFLRADGDVPYRDVARVMAVARRAGMPRVGLVFDPADTPTP